MMSQEITILNLAQQIWKEMVTLGPENVKVLQGLQLDLDTFRLFQSKSQIARSTLLLALNGLERRVLHFESEPGCTILG